MQWGILALRGRFCALQAEVAAGCVLRGLHRPSGLRERAGRAAPLATSGEAVQNAADGLARQGLVPRHGAQAGLEVTCMPGRPGSPGRARNLSSLRLAHSRVITIRVPSASTSRGTVRSLRPAAPGAQVAAEVDEQQQERGCKVLDQRAHERCALFISLPWQKRALKSSPGGKKFQELRILMKIKDI